MARLIKAPKDVLQTAQLEQLCTALEHRGPVSRGVFLAGDGSAGKLPTAHAFVPRGGRTRLERYRRVNDWDSAKLGVTDPRELQEPIRQAIRVASRRRLDSDVPPGAVLDASADVVAMADAGPGTVTTSPVGFGRRKFDELPPARRVAEPLEAEHRQSVDRVRAAAGLVAA